MGEGEGGGRERHCQSPHFHRARHCDPHESAFFFHFASITADRYGDQLEKHSGSESIAKGVSAIGGGRYGAIWNTVM